MSRSNRNARGEASRRKILEITSELVGRYGYDSTTISRIVKETGLPASSIYWMFKNKDELITTALEGTYTAAPAAETGGSPRWHGFQSDQPLVDQLLSELIPALRTTPSEAPLRVGIMLALEGAASDSQVQIPFRRRREAAQARIEKWWQQALREQAPSAHPDKAARLALLTMAFLDGHYVSDLETDDRVVEKRALLLSNILWGSFWHDTSTCLHCNNPGIPPEPGKVPLETEPGERDSTSEALLKSTRYLMAQRGYEGATVARICAHSGVKRSSLYWRYKDKDALVKAAVADPYLKLLRSHEWLRGESSAWIEILATELDSFTYRIRENPDLVKAGLLLALQHWDSPESAGAAVTQGVHQIEKEIALFLDQQQGVEAGRGEYLAWMFMRLQEGMMLDFVLWNQGLSLNNSTCLHSTLSFVLPQWEEQLRGIASAC
ncbi:DNA-binding transcriptional repressor AcrR [Corynebacterium occultum]|uniref:DNA-binding transcriptional repressor AcrR n=1 Tax=Corynebacterium occultum TaxID=2675219 RepID=A0A6B8WAB6_9CORY|nr:TetR/AcrR family transcriptional regulator [Corynebacterium occultum]QGU08225.1 DNA-binding transcriptional repressor AcrR [Corynebacterium occultum]